MRILKSIIIAVSALLFCTGCSGQNSKKQDNMSKSIVIFFDKIEIFKGVRIM